MSGNQSLRNIIGDSGPSTPVWQAGGAASSGPSMPGGGPTNGAAETPSGGKKKGKGKQKQTLFTLGSFPS